MKLIMQKFNVKTAMVSVLTGCFNGAILASGAGASTEIIFNTRRDKDVDNILALDMLFRLLTKQPAHFIGG